MFENIGARLLSSSLAAVLVVYISDVVGVAATRAGQGRETGCYQCFLLRASGKAANADRPVCFVLLASSFVLRRGLGPEIETVATTTPAVSER